MDPSENYITQCTPSNGSNLEILSYFPPQPTHKPPLLFVHGSSISAWCWDVHFMPFFARCGYPCYALSLRGHGASYGRERLAWHSLDDYIDDVHHVVQGMERPPILIGHSMGGLVVQKYLRRAATEGMNIPAIALLTSVPPQGLLPMVWWVSLTRPWLLQEIFWVQTGLVQFSNHQEICAALFSSALPQATAYEYLACTQAESQRALLEMSVWEPFLFAATTAPPMLVLGAEHDALVPTFAVHATAQAFNTTATIIPDMAHFMMLEPHWKHAAKPILAWLEALESEIT